MFDTSHLHPMIVHFPIALLIIGFLFDLAGVISKKDFFNKAGFYLLIFRNSWGCGSLLFRKFSRRWNY